LDARLSPELVGRTNLFDLLGVFWQRYDSKARQHNLKIQQHYETDYLIALPAVRLRFEDAEFILTKIFENAFSFSPENGKIVITIGEQVAEEKSFVWFGLEDDGPGIPDDEIKLIFNRFFRGKAAQELNIPGTGLGLALAQELLVRQGGWIEAKQTVHGGTLFRTFMPSE
jgi:signal transduction histidine kinase